jgi:uncharacterized protein
MLTVRAYVDDSPIHGKGLFAEVDIPKGTLVWRFSKLTDQIVPLDFALTLPELIMDRGYINPRHPDKVVFCGDDSKFMNFSDHPSLKEVVKEPESELIASRNIKAGEELTVAPSTDADYRRKMESRVMA